MFGESTGPGSSDRCCRDDVLLYTGSSIITWAVSLYGSLGLQRSVAAAAPTNANPWPMMCALS